MLYHRYESVVTSGRASGRNCSRAPEQSDFTPATFEPS